MHLLLLITVKTAPNLGRYLNGNTVYQHERGTGLTLLFKGHQMGGMHFTGWPQ